MRWLVLASVLVATQGASGAAEGVSNLTPSAQAQATAEPTPTWELIEPYVINRQAMVAWHAAAEASLRDKIELKLTEPLSYLQHFQHKGFHRALAIEEPAQAFYLAMHPHSPWQVRLAMTDRLIVRRELSPTMRNALPKEIFETLKRRKHFLRPNPHRTVLEQHLQFIELSESDQKNDPFQDPWEYFVRIIMSDKTRSIPTVESPPSDLEAALRGLIDLCKASERYDEALHYSDEVVNTQKWWWGDKCQLSNAEAKTLNRIEMLKGFKGERYRADKVELGCRLVNSAARRMAVEGHAYAMDVLGEVYSSIDHLDATTCYHALMNDPDPFVRWLAIDTAREQLEEEIKTNRYDVRSPDADYSGRPLRYLKERDRVIAAQNALAKEILAGKHDKALKKKRCHLVFYKDNRYGDVWRHLNGLFDLESEGAANDD